MAGSDDSQFETQCLKAHNVYRAKHGCPPLQHNQKLADMARKWAKTLANKNRLEHSSDMNYGENLFMARGAKVEPEEPVKAWYDEIKDYNFAAAKFSSQTGHFTQLVWKSTNEVGVGLARKGSATYVVANYNPPGNVQGAFKENVPPVGAQAGSSGQGGQRKAGSTRRQS